MIVVDIETTGLNEFKNSIVSMGAIDFHNPENQFYEECRIFDGAEVDPKALERNGFTLEQIKDLNKKSLKQIMKEFFDWVERIEIKVLAGHNIGNFDYLFLKNSAERSGLEWPFGRRLVDLHSVCYLHYLKRGIKPQIKDNKSDISLDCVLNYVGLLPEPMPHHALNGAKLEAECFSRIVHGKPLLKEYAQYEIPAYLLSPQEVKVQRGKK